MRDKELYFYENNTHIYIHMHVPAPYFMLHNAFIAFISNVAHCDWISDNFFMNKL